MLGPKPKLFIALFVVVGILPRNIELFSINTSLKLSKDTLILDEPSNDTPAIVTAEANFEAVAEFPVHVTADVAVAALPVVSCVPDVFTPGKLILAEPSNDTPPILRAVVKVAADPVVF